MKREKMSRWLRSACAATLLAGLPLSILAEAPAAAPPTAAPPTAAPPTAAGERAVTGPVGIVSRPSLAEVQVIAGKLGVSTVNAVVRADYDAAGNVTDAAMQTSSGHPELDEALLDWVRRLKLTPGQAGSGSLPFSFSFEQAAPAAQPKVLNMHEDVIAKPSLRAVIQAAARSNLSRIATELLIDYDANGKVTRTRLTEATRSGAVDKALLQWGQALKLKPGEAGSGRLPVTISVD